MAEPAQDFSKELALSQWRDALEAIRLARIMDISTQALPKFWVRAKAGPVLDIWIDCLRTTFSDKHIRKLPVGTDAGRLIGGLDISATLAAGERRFQHGIMSEANGAVLLLRSPASHEAETLQQLCQIMDAGGVAIERDGWSLWQPSRFGHVVIDDSEEEPDGKTAALMDRTTFHIDLANVDLKTAEGLQLDISAEQSATTALAPPAAIETITGIALTLGLASIRPTRQALAVAIASAMVNGRDTVDDQDIQLALRLSLLGRAMAFPEQQEEQPESEPQPEQATDTDTEQEETPPGSSDEIPLEFDVEAMLASLPPGLLELLAKKNRGRAGKKKSGQSGVRDMNFKRGRALSSIRGKPGAGKRLDIVATLRSAAPWQRTRRAADSEDDGSNIRVLPEDFHVRRFRRKAETSIIFVVDASGSTAVQRLGEAKGAVELLLAEGYARRDHVSLISMRGKAAELLLSPTRSLVGAKRCLSNLVGGGGTPLASGIEKASLLASEEHRKGRSVSVVILTDGSANIALDGSAGRTTAHAEAMAAASRFAAFGFSGLVIDVSKLPSNEAEKLAEAMDADYLPMPFASAQNISSAAAMHLRSD